MSQEKPEMEPISEEVEKASPNNNNSNLIKSLIKAQAEFEIVQTNKETEYQSKKGRVSFKWANLGQLRKAINPILAKHNLGVTQDVTNIQGGISVTTMIWHESGESMAGSPFVLPCRTDDPKMVGAHITYACRYDLGAFFNIPIADDIDEQGDQAPEPRTKHIDQNTKVDWYDLRNLGYLLSMSSWSKDDLNREIKRAFGKENMQDLTLLEHNQICVRLKEFVRVEKSKNDDRSPKQKLLDYFASQSTNGLLLDENWIENKWGSPIDCLSENQWKELRQTALDLKNKKHSVKSLYESVYGPIESEYVGLEN